MRGRLRFTPWLAAVLFLGFVARVVYVVGQSSADPTFGLPILDGAYYLEWARALAHGTAGPLGGHPGEIPSAFYLAPLYPFALAGFLRLLGENLSLLFYAQELLVLAAGAFLALAARRLAGGGAGIAAAALLLAYHPALFFAARPLAESLAVALLSAALWLQARDSAASSALGGFVCGIAALTRANLLLVPLAWGAGAAARRRWVRVLLVAAGAGLAILPTAVRNLAASGHPVAVSANGGMTLYHGNGTGAKGIGHFVAGLSSGRVAEQQRAATRLAAFYEGHAVDPVEADGFWARRAVRARWDDPVGSAALALDRSLLLLSNAEVSLDYAPALDPAPWRWLAPVPFAMILGLAAAGVMLAGWRGSGGTPAWGAVAACAAAPWLFYVSSRYRLPMVAMLCVPAGAGLAGLLGGLVTKPGRRVPALALGAAVAGLSLWVPTGEAVAVSEAGALANRARAWLKSGNGDAAKADLDRALALDPDSIPALNAMWNLLAPAGRAAEFEPYYRSALAVHAATPAERYADLVLERVAAGDLGLAWQAVEQAKSEGIALDGLLVERLSAAIERGRVAPTSEGAGGGR